MNELIVIEQYQGDNVEFRQTDGYLNLTALCRAFGKRSNAFMRLPSTIQLWKDLAEELKVIPDALVSQSKGNFGDNRLKGTWIHPELAVAAAAWIDPQFGRWCNKTIKKIIDGNARSNPTPITAGTINHRFAHRWHPVVGVLPGINVAGKWKTPRRCPVQCSGRQIVAAAQLVARNLHGIRRRLLKFVTALLCEDRTRGYLLQDDFRTRRRPGPFGDQLGLRLIAEQQRGFQQPEEILDVGVNDVGGVKGQSGLCSSGQLLEECAGDLGLRLGGFRQGFRRCLPARRQRTFRSGRDAAFCRSAFSTTGFGLREFTGLHHLSEEMGDFFESLRAFTTTGEVRGAAGGFLIHGGGASPVPCM